MLTIVFQLLQSVLTFCWWAVVLAAVMSNLVAFGVLDTRNRVVWTISDVLYRLTEPALRRIRNVLPNMGGLDLSPLVLLLVIWVLQQALGRIYAAIITGDTGQLFF